MRKVGEREEEKRGRREEGKWVRKVGEMERC